MQEIRTTLAVFAVFAGELLLRALAESLYQLSKLVRRGETRLHGIVNSMVVEDRYYRHI
jgi:hypothetical protein